MKMIESWKRLSFQSATGLKYVAGSDKFKSHRTEYKAHISSNLEAGNWQYIHDRCAAEF
jgi:hypothetical protein